MGAAVREPDSDDVTSRIYWASTWEWKRQKMLDDLAAVHESGITEEEIREAVEG